jgi:hypothetical protein
MTNAKHTPARHSKRDGLIMAKYYTGRLVYTVEAENKTHALIVIRLIASGQNTIGKPIISVDFDDDVDLQEA